MLNRARKKSPRTTPTRRSPTSATTSDPTHLSLTEPPTDSETDTAYTHPNLIDAIAELLRGRGFTVHVGSTHGHRHDDGTFHTLLLTAHNQTISVWGCGPTHQDDWHHRRRQSTTPAKRRPPSTPPAVRAELHTTLHQIATTATAITAPDPTTAHDPTTSLAAHLHGEPCQHALTAALASHWQHWWDTRIAEGHTPDATTMLLALTMPPSDQPLFAYDQQGRPTGTST